MTRATRGPALRRWDCPRHPQHIAFHRIAGVTREMAVHKESPEPRAGLKCQRGRFDVAAESFLDILRPAECPRVRTKHFLRRLVGLMKCAHTSQSPLSATTIAPT
jgi:hypothetical protein